MNQSRAEEALNDLARVVCSEYERHSAQYKQAVADYDAGRTNIKAVVESYECTAMMQPVIDGLLQAHELTKPRQTWYHRFLGRIGLDKSK